MTTLPQVWGYWVGFCAWCLNVPATDSYEDEQAGGELVSYQVCAKCKEEM